MLATKYQIEASKTALYKNPLYPFLALCEEAGEVAGVMAKHIRKGGDVEQMNTAQLTKMHDELGDVAWNLAMCCDELGFDLGEVMQANNHKLKMRQKHDDLDPLGRSEVQ